MAKFSSKNFPKQKNIINSGERTCYVPCEHNILNYQIKPFVVSKKTNLYFFNNRVTDLLPNDEVYFTYPSELFRGEEIGLESNKKTLFAKVSLNSDIFSPVGYVAISSIEKPSGNFQKRVESGKIAQEKVAEYIKSLNTDKKIETIHNAKQGSNNPDLLLDIDGRIVQIEVKNKNNLSGFITLFDKSVSRNKKNVFLDDLTEAFVIKNDYLLENNIHDFESVVDYYRRFDSSIGFPGDKGVNKSGKLPPELISSCPDVCEYFRKVILDNMIERNDDYFALVSATGVYVYAISDKNILNLPKFPKLLRVGLITYGGPSSGAMRVGIKVSLDT